MKRNQILPCALLALGLAAPALGAEPKADAKANAKADASAEAKSEAEVEARLDAARARLEAAAREVAELSSQLNGKYMDHFEVVRRDRGSRASLGIGIDGDDSDQPGVQVDSVSPNGPASKAGLKAGDVLVSIDGKDLRKPAEGQSGERLLVSTMRGKKPGDKVSVEYQRDGKTQKTEITTESMDLTRFARHRAVPAIPAMPAVPAAPAAPDMPFNMVFRDHPGRGLELITLTPKLGQYFGADKGALVVRAPRDATLKLEEGDVIVDIGGRVPQSGSHAMRILRSYQPGEKATINVLRNRKSAKVEYTVPKRDEETGAQWFSFPDFEFEWDAEPSSRPEPPKAPAAPAAPSVESTST